MNHRRCQLMIMIDTVHRSSLNHHEEIILISILPKYNQHSWSSVTTIDLEGQSIKDLNTERTERSDFLELYQMYFHKSNKFEVPIENPLIDNLISLHWQYDVLIECDVTCLFSNSIDRNNVDIYVVCTMIHEKDALMRLDMAIPDHHHHHRHYYYDYHRSMHWSLHQTLDLFDFHRYFVVFFFFLFRSTKQLISYFFQMSNKTKLWSSTYICRFLWKKNVDR